MLNFQAKTAKILAWLDLTGKNSRIGSTFRIFVLDSSFSCSLLLPLAAKNQTTLLVFEWWFNFFTRLLSFALKRLSLKTVGTYLRLSVRELGYNTINIMQDSSHKLIKTLIEELSCIKSDSFFKGSETSILPPKHLKRGGGEVAGLSEALI